MAFEATDVDRDVSALPEAFHLVHKLQICPPSVFFQAAPDEPVAFVVDSSWETIVVEPCKSRFVSVIVI
jgi:hypothetical protein